MLLRELHATGRDQQYISHVSNYLCLYVSTFLSRQNLSSRDHWQQVYGAHAQNEIYHIQLHKSVFFGRYQGEAFPRASADAHSRWLTTRLSLGQSGVFLGEITRYRR